METCQNRGEGFDVGEENGRFLILKDVADHSYEIVNLCHTTRDVIDDEILHFFDSKEKQTRFIFTERFEKLRNRIRDSSVDDEILLGDEEISNFWGEVFFVARKRIDGGFELRRSGGVSERIQEKRRIEASENVVKPHLRLTCCCVFLHSSEDLEEFRRPEFLLGFFIGAENSLQRVRDPLNRIRVVYKWNDEREGFDDGKRVEEFVGRSIESENVVDGRSDPTRIERCFRAMKTFQNRG